MIQVSISPDEVIRIKLVLIECVSEEVCFGEHDHIVELESELRVILFGEGSFLQPFLSYTLHMRIKTKLSKCLYFFENKDCIVWLAAFPYISLDVFATKDDEVGVCLE